MDFIDNPFLQVGASAVSGGLGAELSGGDFWRGAATGGIVAGANHGLHKLQEVNPDKLRARILKDGRLTLKEASQWYTHGGGR